MCQQLFCRSQFPEFLNAIAAAEIAPSCCRSGEIYSQIGCAPSRNRRTSYSHPVALIVWSGWGFTRWWKSLPAAWQALNHFAGLPLNSSRKTATTDDSLLPPSIITKSGCVGIAYSAAIADLEHTYGSDGTAPTPGETGKIIRVTSSTRDSYLNKDSVVLAKLPSMNTTWDAFRTLMWDISLQHLVRQTGSQESPPDPPLLEGCDRPTSASEYWALRPPSQSVLPCLVAVVTIVSFRPFKFHFKNFCQHLLIKSPMH